MSSPAGNLYFNFIHFFRRLIPLTLADPTVSKKLLTVMSKKHFLFLLLPAAGSGAAIAQTIKDSSFKPLDQVVVTATKYPVKESLTGKVLTVITKEQLEKSGGKQLTEILNTQAGIIIVGAQNALGTVPAGCSPAGSGCGKDPDPHRRHSGIRPFGNEYLLRSEPHQYRRDRKSGDPERQPVDPLWQRCGGGRHQYHHEKRRRQTPECHRQPFRGQLRHLENLGRHRREDRQYRL